MLNHRMQAHMYMHTHARMHACTQNLLQSETGKFITKFIAVIPGSICYELHLDMPTSSIGKQKTNKAIQKENRKQQKTFGQETLQINLLERTPVAKPWQQPRQPSSETGHFFLHGQWRVKSSS